MTVTALGDPRKRWHYTLILALLILLLVIPGASAWGAPPTQSAADAKALFDGKCGACHTIGGGRLAGPDLQGVTTRRDKQWLTRWIAAPDKMLSQGDPIAAQLLKEYTIPMPNMGLTDAQVASLLTYLETASGGAAPQAGQASAPATAMGDPVIGKDLFTGVIGLKNGGSPCIACHTVSGIGALGGGALGPDLTAAYGKYGDAGLGSVLASIPFPTMNPIFSSRPLTPEEQASLKAFLQAASAAQRAPESMIVLGGLAVVGAAVLMIVGHLYWRRRLVQVRRPLVAR